MTNKQKLGLLLLSLPFIGMFTFVAMIKGIIPALIAFSLLVSVGALVFFGVILISEG